MLLLPLLFHTLQVASSGLSVLPEGSLLLC